MTNRLVHIVGQDEIGGDGGLDGIQRPGLVREVGQVVPPELVDDFVEIWEMRSSEICTDNLVKR